MKHIAVCLIMFVIGFLGQAYFSGNDFDLFEIKAYISLGILVVAILLVIISEYNNNKKQ